MSRIFKQIIESNIEPNKENIWLYKGSFNQQDKEAVVLMNYSLIGG